MKRDETAMQRIAMRRDGYAQLGVGTDLRSGERQRCGNEQIGYEAESTGIEWQRDDTALRRSDQI